MGFITKLQVFVVPEPDLLKQMDSSGPPQKLDRDSVEKTLGLFRYIVLKGDIWDPGGPPVSIYGHTIS